MPFEHLGLQIPDPIRVALALLLSLPLSACGGGGGGMSTYTIGGTVSGLTAPGLTLTDNGGATLAVASGATTFTFPTPLANGATYDVAIASQPTGETCSVSLAAGKVSGNVTTVSITCGYTIGGTLRGLKSGAQLTLLDMGSDALTLVKNGTFTFSEPLAAGRSYDVTVGTQPSGQFCEVTAGIGTVSSAVTNVQVACLTVLYSFAGGSDGADPLGGLIMDTSGDLYGTTQNGGSAGSGTVFELSPTPAGGYAESVLHSFTGSAISVGTADGASPRAGLIADGAGDLYGTTYNGGPSGWGDVYELSPAAGGGYAESILYSFSGGSDGGGSSGVLVRDSAGNLYGTTTTGGGLIGDGTVFKLTAGNGGYTESILHVFTGNAGGSDGASPQAGLIFDSAGNLYGTTSVGAGVFELSPAAAGAYTEATLYTFAGRDDGSSPQSSLIMDSAGNLFGTTQSGGSGGYGTVFKLAPNGNGGYSESILFSFTDRDDGASPQSDVVMDGAGDLYGTTEYGGGSDYGTVFELVPNGSGGYTEVTLYSFTGGIDGAGSVAGLILDSAGNLYGTAQGGGSSGGYGTVFEIYPH